MSVCTGAFLHAETGLLNGKSATTHHGAYGRFGMQYAKSIRLRRGARFVDEGKVASAGGLTSGMDLAFHVIERYFGRQAAEDTAYYMEYQGEGWKDSTGAANALYGKSRPTDCPVCGMPAQTSGLSATFKGPTYYFCSNQCKNNFESTPDRFLA
jgi:YHS domain-containing protein